MNHSAGNWKPSHDGERQQVLCPIPCFLDRDLNVFSFRIADGKGVSNPKTVPAGTDVRTLKDSGGPEVYAAGQKPEGQITEVGRYMFPKPGTTAPAFPKVSFVTRVGDLVCGVGYYK
jgi:hypothetical protein